MQANWSLILNVLLLIGVIVAIGYLMKARRKSLGEGRYQPNLGVEEEKLLDNKYSYQEDIIAVRKVNTSFSEVNDSISSENLEVRSSQPRLISDEEGMVLLKAETKTTPSLNGRFIKEFNEAEVGTTLIMFLVAKENRQFAGYELLQTVLAAGLRFGEDGLFHRHQLARSEGAIICSLAAATATGIFDLQNIGAFSVRGLCLFMQSTNNHDGDTERFSMMLDTARLLSEGLDAHLLDDQRQLLTEERIERYYNQLQLNYSHLEAV
ncbi:cell division protein ZipA C-terminal FtsZ-binding domain-containing protein [Legionella sp.]|uniref:cell division protein ZipA C-terminal FtsZ-binding domain-containing protein n=1 Tax=Legionella sp. TaxID=459 RepID=UPI003CB9BBF7